MPQQVQNAVVPVGKSEFVEEIEKTFEVTDLAALVVAVSNISGSIVVEAWQQPTVHIRALKRARSQRSFDRTQVEISQEGAEIRARTRIDEETIIAGVMDLLRGDRAGATVDYTVHMPAAGALRAKNINGTVAVSGLTNRSDVNAVNGAVSLINLAGHTDAGTVNGSLKAAGLSGAAKLSTVNGSLDLVGAELGQLEARTVSGGIRAAFSIAPDGRYEFSTTNGNCELTLPAGSRCTLTMESVNGGVECALPHTTIASEMRPAFSSWAGAVNGGGAPVGVRTVNGRLRVFAGSASDTPGDAPAKPAAERAKPAERGTMDILRAVERGELSVDDAMKAMGAKPSKTTEVPGEHVSS
jgi:Putative adhesin